MSDLITIGKITKQQGNKGELRVLPLTDFPERFTYLESVLLVRGESTEKKEIEKVRFHKKFIIIKLAGVDNIGQAIAYRDYLLKIPVEQMVPLLEDQYYIFELLDYQVYLKEGELLGTVQDIKTTGGTDIFIITDGKKEYMIPAAREFITVKQDCQRIIVDPIPGLLDL